MPGAFPHQLERPWSQQFTCGQIAGTERTAECILNSGAFEFRIRREDRILPGQFLSEVACAVKAEAGFLRAGHMYKQFGRVVELRRWRPGKPANRLKRGLGQAMLRNKIIEKISEKLKTEKKVNIARVAGLVLVIAGAWLIVASDPLMFSK